MSFGGFGGGDVSGSGGDKGLSLPLNKIFRLAWADPDLKQRLTFILLMFAVFTLGAHIPVPIPGYAADSIAEKLGSSFFFQMLDSFGGGALRRLSIFALGLNPYITASIVIQILTTAFPAMKKEMEEGGEYARKKQNQRTRALTLALCFLQGSGFLQMITSAVGPLDFWQKGVVLAFWTAGSMFCLWMGEQISERGIGNGTSLIIFAGIIVGLPYQGQKIINGLSKGIVPWTGVIILIAMFLVSTWAIVYFTAAQRRIPIQHMRRTFGTKVVGGKTSYLPLSLMMAGVLPIIFASALTSIPQQIGTMFGGEKSAIGKFFFEAGQWLYPGNSSVVAVWLPIPKGIFASLIYCALIFFFTYFWTAIQYNVEDISNNLKKAGSYIPGVRPGKQTKDFLDGIISRVTVVGAGFIAIVALLQYIAPAITGLSAQNGISVVGGTSLLIMVSVALETMRQIEANLLMKQYQ